MPNRVLSVSIALGLAGVVLLLAWVLGPAGATKPRPVPRLDPNQLPGGIDGSQTNIGRHGTIIGQTENFRLDRFNDKGQLTQVFGRRITPRKEGVIDVDDPGARIFLEPHRVLQITSVRGTFDAPENQPRSGELSGDVVVAMFECAPGSQPNLSPTSPHLRLRVYLEQATFDLVLGQIESSGQVLVDGPGFAFAGTGLQLTFNEKRKRIERLQITRGQSLRFAPRAADEASAQKKPGPDAEPKEARGAEPVQFYRARFDTGLKVTSKDADILADAMVVYFSIDGGAGRELLSMRPAPTPRAAARRTWTPSVTLAGSVWPMLSVLLWTQVNPSPDEVVLAWSGPMLVEPEDSPPADLAGPRDVLLQMFGRPVRVTTARREVVTAASVDYLLSASRVRLTGSVDFPMEINSPQLGVLRGSALVVNQNAGTGQILGAGTLVAHGEPGLADALDPRRDSEGLPRGFAMAWSDRLDLSFYLRPSDKPDQPRQVSAIRTAAMRGGVTVTHPQFDMRTDLLAIALDDPAQGRQALRSIDCSGNVQVGTRPTAREPELAMQSDTMRIELDRDAAGRAEPARLLARGGVKASQPNRSIAAGRLDVTLRRPSDDAPRRGDEQRVAVHSLDAQEDVRVTLSDPDAQIAADRLLADAEADAIELIGTTRPARIVRVDGSLEGGRILVGGAKQTVHVIGPGEFTFLSMGKPKPGAPANDKPSVAQVNVTWQQFMHFSNVAGTAEFVGDVVAQGQSGLDTTRLTSRSLSLSFTPTARGDKTASLFGESDAPRAATDSDRVVVGRVLRLATAKDDAVFLAESWQDRVGGGLATRLRLAGPSIHFDNSAAHVEQVQVVGTGSMLAEDYRPNDRRATSAASAPLTGVAFAGRGATLFTWTGQLTLDALRNDMMIQERVQMLHRPMDNPANVVQLDCRRFVADLEENGGLGSWMSGEAPAPRLVGVFADEAVTVRGGGRTVQADRMVYRGADQSLSLLADPGRMVELTEADSPQAMTAEGFKWDLRRNRIEIDRPGPGRVPLR